MKKKICIFLCFIILICIIISLFIFDDDFVIKEKNQNINIRINCDSVQCVKEETKKIAIEWCESDKDIFLGKISWEFLSKQDFKNKLGKQIYTYYLYRGEKKGYDLYERCDITVNLNNKSVTNIKNYGNRNTGGNELRDGNIDTIYESVYNEIYIKEQYLSEDANIKLDISSDNIEIYMLMPDNIQHKGFLVDERIIWQ